MSSDDRSIIHIQRSENVAILDSSIRNINQLVLEIDTGSSMTLEEVEINSVSQTVKLTKGSSLNILDSNITNTGNDELEYGGAVSTQNSNLTINGSKFMN